MKIIKKYYESQWVATIGKELRIHYLIRTILEKFSDKDFIRLFQIIKISKIGDYISLYGDMDFPKAFAFKIIKNSLFITFLLKYLFKNTNIFVKLIKIIPK